MLGLWCGISTLTGVLMGIYRSGINWINHLDKQEWLLVLMIVFAAGLSLMWLGASRR